MTQLEHMQLAEIEGADMQRICGSYILGVTGNKRRVHTGVALVPFSYDEPADTIEWWECFLIECIRSDCDIIRQAVGTLEVIGEHFAIFCRADNFMGLRGIELVAQHLNGSEQRVRIYK